MFRSMRSVRRKVSASFTIKKKYTASEPMEIICVSRRCYYVNKKIDVSTEQCFNVKFCVRLKKSKVKMVLLLKEAFQVKT